MPKNPPMIIINLLNVINYELDYWSFLIFLGLNRANLLSVKTFTHLLFRNAVRVRVSE
jgi:hypothetical protein